MSTLGEDDELTEQHGEVTEQHGEATEQHDGVSERHDEVRVHDYDQGSLVLDARRFPVVVTNAIGNVGRPGAETMSHFMDEMVDRAVAEDVRLVIISDITRITRTRREDIRYVVERTDARQLRAPGRVLAGLVVVDRPLMRGMVALALWLSKHPVAMLTVPTFEAAAQRARALLMGAGVAMPADLDALIEHLERARAH